MQVTTISLLDHHIYPHLLHYLLNVISREGLLKHKSLQAGCGGSCLEFKLLVRQSSRGLPFKASLGEKVSKNPMSTNNLGVRIHICNSSYIRGVGRRIVAQGWSRQKE
jgi:hypothetical protein